MAAAVFFLARWLPSGGSDVWERGFRSAGTVLQVFGIVTVALGVRNTRKQFREPGVPGPAEKWLLDAWEAAKAGARWLKAKWLPIFGRKPTPVNASIAARLDDATVGLTGQVVGVVVQPALTNEQRIELLEKGLATANERIDGTERRLIQEKQERERADSQEHDQRKQVDEEIREKLKNVSVGGLSLSLMGAWWLLIGTGLAGFSPELAHATAPLVGCS